MEAVLKRRQKKGGMTRLGAFRALQIEKPELMSTGEIKLPGGKNIENRQYKYI